MLSVNLEQTLHRALTLASEHRHEYATIEHLLCSLVDDSDASIMLHSCGVDLGILQKTLRTFIIDNSASPTTDKPGDPTPTANFQRVVQHAANNVLKIAGNKEITGVDVLISLFSEEESHAVYFLHQQGMTQQKAIDFAYFNNTITVPPPSLPQQGVGPHVEINSDGVITFSPPEALDTDGNHLPRLRALHLDLRELACGLAADFGSGNVPYAVLHQRVLSYKTLIDQNLKDIDFRRLYASGVRLTNALNATKQAILDGDLPPFSLASQSEVESLISLHGSFILATAAGAEALLDEERFVRRPAQERQLRADTIAVATALLSRPDLVEPSVAEQLLGASQEISTGTNPERSTSIGNAIFRNVMIGIAGCAIGSIAVSNIMLSTSTITGTGRALSWLSLLGANEAIKKMSWFQALTSSTSLLIDDAINSVHSIDIDKTARTLFLHKNFLMTNEAVLCLLARKNAELEFLDGVSEWLTGQHANH